MWLGVVCNKGLYVINCGQVCNKGAYSTSINQTIINTNPLLLMYTKNPDPYCWHLISLTSNNNYLAAI